MEARKIAFQDAQGESGGAMTTTRAKITKKPASDAAAVIRKALAGPVDADLLVEATKYRLQLLVDKLEAPPGIQMEVLEGIADLSQLFNELENPTGKTTKELDELCRLVEALEKQPTMQRTVIHGKAKPKKRSPRYLDTGRALWLIQARIAARHLSDALEAGDAPRSAQWAMEAVRWASLSDPMRQRGMSIVVHASMGTIEHRNKDGSGYTRKPKWDKPVKDAMELHPNDYTEAAKYLKRKGMPKNSISDTLKKHYPPAKTGRPRKG